MKYVDEGLAVVKDFVAAIYFAIDYLNVGNAIALYIDSRDIYRNNGGLG